MTVLTIVRRDMILAASPIFFDRYKVDEDTQKDFKRLMEHFAHASGKRNEIAHGIVVHVWDIGYFLIPPSYNSDKTMPLLHQDAGKEKDLSGELRVKYRYTTEQVRAYGLGFNLLSHAAVLVLRRIEKYVPH